MKKQQSYSQDLVVEELSAIKSAKSELIQDELEKEESLLTTIQQVRDLLAKEEKDIKSGLKAKRVILKKLHGGKPTKIERSPSLSGDFDHSWKHQDKVRYVLKQIKNGTVQEIAAELKSMDPTIKTDRKAKTVASYHCSVMYTQGIIGAERIGKKYVYHFNNKKRISKPKLEEVGA